jgi:hypothetical protein
MVGPMKMGTRDIATHRICRTPVASCKTSEIPMGRRMVYRVTTSRLPIPAKEPLSPCFCAKSVTEIQFMVRNGVFCEVLPPKTSGRGPMRQTGSLSSCSRVDGSLSPLLQPMHR